jgi:hypothetical protein
MTTSAPTHPSLCATSPTEPAQTLKVFLRQIRCHFGHIVSAGGLFCGPRVSCERRPLSSAMRRLFDVRPAGQTSRRTTPRGGPERVAQKRRRSGGLRGGLRHSEGRVEEPCRRPVEANPRGDGGALLALALAPRRGTECRSAACTLRTSSGRPVRSPRHARIRPAKRQRSAERRDAWSSSQASASSSAITTPTCRCESSSASLHAPH